MKTVLVYVAAINAIVSVLCLFTYDKLAAIYFAIVVLVIIELRKIE